MENCTQNQNSAIIKPINRQTVHRICSGQVVLSLAIAVKELVENAIDASATNIEIRLKEYGSDSVEVLDNGAGVKEDNFEALTLKHYTSKIEEFSDLESVNTMGFRGEALSSLCALCDLSVITKHVTANYATKIDYDYNGLIKKKVPSARCQGTTVQLTNLFSTLPVRRKEFVKNLKREFNKMCQLLYAYCLVCKNIRISCTNTINKGTKNVIVMTQGLNSIRDNIIAVFGAKQTLTLIDVNICKPNQDILNEYNLSQIDEDNTKNFDFDFFISGAQHGNGRSASDRQFYFINDRPCEPYKIIKLVNNIYRQYNGNQYPFVYLNVKLAKSEIDVNVTPDKRQIFLQQEKLLLAYIKASLLNAFKGFPSTYECQNLNVSKLICENDGITESQRNNIKKRKQDDDVGNDEEKQEVSFFDAFKNAFESKEKTLQDNKKLKINISSSFASKQSKLNESKTFKIEYHDKESSDEKLNSLIDFAIEHQEDKEEADRKIKVDVDDCKEMTAENLNETISHDLNQKKESHNIIEEYITDMNDEKLICRYVRDHKSAPKIIKAIAKDVKNLQSTSSRRYTVRNSINWNVSLDEILKRIDSKQQSQEVNLKTIKFRSKISPNCNKEAELELQKNFDKDSFKEMQVIGQFNLAFIIAKLRNDLFIIDQHASDEKFNFEQLQRSTVLDNQKLVNPKLLELTAGNETLLIDNIEIFKKNGFEFDIKDDAEATKKIHLKAIPMSRNYVFGKDDIDEMLFMLKECDVTTCRPSKVSSMLASRACRKSVMVGRHLAKSEMKNIISHMGDIEQPWNCPHGRPTMRHLINLNLIDV